MIIKVTESMFADEMHRHVEAPRHAFTALFDWLQNVYGDETEFDAVEIATLYTFHADALSAVRDIEGEEWGVAPSTAGELTPEEVEDHEARAAEDARFYLDEHATVIDVPSRKVFNDTVPGGLWLRVA